MQMITTTADLEQVCSRFAGHPYVAVDTEFMRERTYYSQLCLVQMAVGGPDGAMSGEAVLVDPLAEGIDLAPLWALMAAGETVKVFHAARQDIEIFHHQGKVIPAPMFDTQVAAMVLGYGEQVGYETLVRRVAKAELDKSSRFTDWARRPLSEKQLTYAIGDVTHLRVVYEALAARLASSGREEWVAEEMAILADPATYETEPGEAWRRVKARTGNSETLAVVRELARWREEAAQSRDVPRSRLLKDDALVEIAAAKPRDAEGLGKMRLLQREGRKPETSEAILEAVARGLATPAGERPRLDPPPRRREGSAAVSDLMRVFLKARADSLGVAPKLLASSADLDALAGEEDPDVPALHGWRFDAFGRDALRLKDGGVALCAGRKGIEVIELPAGEDATDPSTRPR
ncbi:MAG: ribonuclease D [Pseudomonadota bacterium]